MLPRLPWLSFAGSVLLPALLLALVPAVARASLVLAFDLDGLTRVADRVVVGEVLSVRSEWEGGGHRRIVTIVDVQVAEVWKGEVPSSRRVRIVQPGGRVGDIEMRVHGLASFREGQRGVLFLEGAPTNSGVVGLGQGLRRLERDATSGRWIARAGDRSAAVLRGPDGKLRAAPPETDLPLETLRDRVRALVLQ